MTRPSFVIATALLLAASPARAQTEGKRFIQIDEGEEGPQPRTEGARIQVGGLVQVLAGATPDLTGGFRVRRARFTFDGQLEQILRTQIFIEGEVAPGSDLLSRPLSEGYVAFDVASRSIANVGRLRIGQTRIGFGRELGLEPQELPFIDRGLTSRCLGPGAQHVTTSTGQPSQLQATGRDVGMRYDLHVDLPRRFSADAVLGAYSGVGPNRVDDTVGPLLVGRARIAYGRKEEPGHLHVTWGASIASNASDEVRAGCGGVDPVLASGIETRRLGGDLHLRWRGLSLDSEVIFLRTHAGTQGAPLVEFPLDGTGWWASAGVFVLPEFAELTARYEQVRRSGPTLPDATGFALGLTDFDELTLGVNARYYGDRFRLQYNFVQRTQSGPAFRGVVSQSHVVAFTIYL